MIDHFVELIDDDTDFDTAAEIAYASDPRPMEFATRGDLSSESAKLMQMSVRQMQDAEEEIESLRGTVEEQARTIEKMQDVMDQQFAQVMRLMKVLNERGIIKDDGL